VDDAEQIRALVHSYAHLIDEGDLDGVAALFEHATWRSGRTGAVRRGAAEVREVFDDVILYDGTPRTQHAIANLTVISDGGAIATARSSFTVTQALPDFPLQPILAGRYDDELERIDGEWRFTDRVVHADLIGDLSRHMRGGTPPPGDSLRR